MYPPNMPKFPAKLTTYIELNGDAPHQDRDFDYIFQATRCWQRPIYFETTSHVVTGATKILENVFCPTLQIVQPPLMFLETLPTKSQFPESILKEIHKVKIQSTHEKFLILLCVFSYSFLLRRGEQGQGLLVAGKGQLELLMEDMEGIIQMNWTILV